MLYTRSISDPPRNDRGHYDPSLILRDFNYLSLLGERNRRAIAEHTRDRGGLDLLSDVSAAAIAQLHEQGMVDVERLWPAAASFFHQAILMRGFASVPRPGQELSKPGPVDVLVAGTQAPEILRARVEGCVRTLGQLPRTRCRIVFSGANPGREDAKRGLRSRVRTVSEAADMELHFHQLVAEHEESGEWHEAELLRDEEADSTIKNIEHFAAVLRNDAGARPVEHVVVVSSLYHLPRFIDLMASRLSQEFPDLQRLSFISSEHPMEPLPAPLHSRDYLRSMMFEYYLHLLEEPSAGDHAARESALR